MKRSEFFGLSTFAGIGVFCVGLATSSDSLSLTDWAKQHGASIVRIEGGLKIQVRIARNELADSLQSLCELSDLPLRAEMNTLFGRVKGESFEVTLS